MIPNATPSTGYLPPGVHTASWSEVHQRFCWNDHRIYLASGLLAALYNLAGAKCRSIILNGSFVSLKELPNDYDGAWNPSNVNVSLIDPVLLNFANGREAMKSKYRGELFPLTSRTNSGDTFLEFFQTDRNNVKKGVINIDLRSLP